MADTSSGDGHKWEYRFTVKQTERHMITELNELGREGWEVITVSYNKDMKGVWCWTAFMKRPFTGTAFAPAPVPGQDQSQESPPADGGPQGFDLSEGDFGFKE